MPMSPRTVTTVALLANLTLWDLPPPMQPAVHTRLSEAALAKHTSTSSSEAKRAKAHPQICIGIPLEEQTGVESFYF